MLTISFDLNLALNVILTAIHITAIGLTLFRFYYRTVTRRLWWDDFVALSSMLVDCAYLTVLWFEYAGPDSTLQTHNSRILRYWLGLMLPFVAIWGTRISLALAIARIFPPGDPTRIFAIGMAVLSLAFCFIIIIRSAVLCAHQPSLNISRKAVCQWTTDLRVLVFMANVVSDGLLVATPLYKLWHVRLPRKQRRLILGAFAASLFTASASLVCAVFQFAPENLEPAKTNLQKKFSYLEAGISLVVCNLLVVVTYVHMRSHRGEDLEPSEETSETCESRVEPVSHSNNVPPSTHDPYTTPYILTEITDAYTDSHTIASTRLLGVSLPTLQPESTTSNSNFSANAGSH